MIARVQPQAHRHESRRLRAGASSVVHDRSPRSAKLDSRSGLIARRRDGREGQSSGSDPRSRRRHRRRIRTTVATSRPAPANPAGTDQFSRSRTLTVCPSPASGIFSGVEPSAAGGRVAARRIGLHPEETCHEADVLGWTAVALAGLGLRRQARAAHCGACAYPRPRRARSSAARRSSATASATSRSSRSRPGLLPAGLPDRACRSAVHGPAAGLRAARPRGSVHRSAGRSSSTTTVPRRTRLPAGVRAARPHRMLHDLRPVVQDVPGAAARTAPPAGVRAARPRRAVLHATARSCRNTRSRSRTAPTGRSTSSTSARTVLHRTGRSCRSTRCRSRTAPTARSTSSTSAQSRTPPTGRSSSRTRCRSRTAPTGRCTSSTSAPSATRPTAPVVQQYQVAVPYTHLPAGVRAARTDVPVTRRYTYRRSTTAPQRGYYARSRSSPSRR